jgi:hypothetical protein
MNAAAAHDLAYPDLKGTDKITEDCWKCGGSGVIQAFRNVVGGQCFACGGGGTSTVLVSSVRARRRRRARREAERAQAESARAQLVGDANDAAIAELVAAYPPFAAAVDERGRTLTREASAAVVAVRDNHAGGVQEAVASYRWSLGEIVDRLRPNRFPGKCRECMVPVPADAGWAGMHRHAVGGWATFCADHKPESRSGLTQIAEE